MDKHFLAKHAQSQRDLRRLAEHGTVCVEASGVLTTSAHTNSIWYDNSLLRGDEVLEMGRQLDSPEASALLRAIALHVDGGIGTEPGDHSPCDPTHLALIKMVDTLADIGKLRGDWLKTYESPYSCERTVLERVHYNSTTGKALLSVCGPMRHVQRMSLTMLCHGGEVSMPGPDDIYASAGNILEPMEHDGEHTLAFAQAEIMDADLIALIARGEEMDASKLPLDCMCFLGVVGIAKDVTDDANELFVCLKDFPDMKIELCTMDAPHVAVSLCQQARAIEGDVHLMEEGGLERALACTSAALAALSSCWFALAADDRLKLRNKFGFIILAGMSPESKAEEVKELRASDPERGVMFVGAQLADAEAFKEAHLGVVVCGECASDVAKAHADVLLTDGSVQSLVAKLRSTQERMTNRKRCAVC